MKIQSNQILIQTFSKMQKFRPKIFSWIILWNQYLYFWGVLRFFTNFMPKITEKASNYNFSEYTIFYRNWPFSKKFKRNDDIWSPLYKTLCFHNLNYFCWIFARENRRSIKDFRASYFCFFLSKSRLEIKSPQIWARDFFSFLRFFFNSRHSPFKIKLIQK